MLEVEVKQEDIQDDGLLENGLKILRLLGFHGHKLKISMQFGQMPANTLIFDGKFVNKNGLQKSSLVMVLWPMGFSSSFASRSSYDQARMVVDELLDKVFIDGAEHDELWISNLSKARTKKLMEVLFEQDIPVSILKHDCKIKLPISMATAKRQSLGFKSTCIEEAMLWFFGLNGQI